MVHKITNIINDAMAEKNRFFANLRLVSSDAIANVMPIHNDHNIEPTNRNGTIYATIIRDNSDAIVAPSGVVQMLAIKLPMTPNVVSPLCVPSICKIVTHNTNISK